MGLRNVVVLFLAGLLVVFMPIFLYRFHHPALCGHFLVLLAIGLHFKISKSKLYARNIFWYVPLLCTAMLVHVYLFAMVLGVFVWTILHGLWTERLSAMTASVRIISVIAILIPIMLLTGHLGSIGLRPKSYGEYGFNLISPFVPQMSGLMPGHSSYLLQHGETFTYLGAGALLLFIMAVPVVWTQRKEILERHFSTVIAIGLITVFAASYAVYVGPYLMLGISEVLARNTVLAYFREGTSILNITNNLQSIDLLRILLYFLLLIGFGIWSVRYALKRGKKQFLTFTVSWSVFFGLASAFFGYEMILVPVNFQASARFMWIVIYLSVAASIVFLSRRLVASRLVPVLMVAFALQVLDTKPLQAILLGFREAKEGEIIRDQKEIENAFRGATRVIITPSYLCAQTEMKQGSKKWHVIQTIEILQYIASLSFTPINSTEHARMTSVYRHSGSPDCESEKREALNRTAGQGAVYFFVPGIWDSPDSEDKLSRDPRCRRLSEGYLCR